MLRYSGLEPIVNNLKGFMDLPTVEQRRAAHQAFQNATSNNALSMSVCTVCARELMTKEGDEKVIFDLPNVQELLAPDHAHPAHELWEGMLLFRNGVHGNGKYGRGWICHDCTRSLMKKKRPPLALSNNMWIGQIPHALKVLTIPEHLLIARHYPRCFVFKLFPKDPNQHTHPDHLQHGIAGNVTLYEMNTASIAEMLEGKLMPHAGALLASVLAVTFVGTKKLPKEWLKSTFRVRRRRVYEALVWLKENNPLYEDIDISHDRLAKLPEDDVPEEIIAIARHEENGNLAVKERALYNPGASESDSEGSDDICK